MKILITAGGCKEPIDRIRHIANFSSGQTGLFLTYFFLEKKHEVTLLISSDISISSYIKDHAHIEKFTTFEDIKESLISLLKLKHFDSVIHLAAVSDYFVSDIFLDGVSVKNQRSLKKITGSKEITLKLKQNPKLLSQLKSFSKNKDIFIVGFKLTDTPHIEEEKAQVKEMLLNNNIDGLVHNRFNEVEGDQHIAQIYKKGVFFRKTETKKQLAQVLLEIIS